MSFDQRHRWIINRISESFHIEDPSVVEDCIAVEKNLAHVNEFFKADGPPRLLFYYQPFEDEGEVTPGEEVTGPNGPKKLYLTSGGYDPLRGKALYFVRVTTKSVTPGSVDTDLSYGELLDTPMNALEAVLSNIYTPMLCMQEDWGKNPEDATKDFINHLIKFHDLVCDSVGSISSGVDLRKPDKKYDVDNKPPALARAAADPELVEHYEEVVENWCKDIENLLHDLDNRKEADDVGPNTELEFWKTRMAKFNSIAEQLKSKECKVVLAVLNNTKSKTIKHWRQVDNAITDAANEAKDNVKYLTTLEKYTEPLYSGDPETIKESLPGLLNNIKMMHTIARYYNTTERMTTLFVKITNQMIANCKQFIRNDGKLWEQDPIKLIENLEACLRLNEAYQEHYRLTKDKLLTQPKGKQFDFNENQIFGKFELFCKRGQKLGDMFSTIFQFNSLAKHNIEGMESLIAKFFSIVDDMRKAPYDLLDHTKNQYDRDYLEFNVQINELEVALQGFINSSFENISSTELALNLLKQFQSILQRENLKADLDSKYQVIFHNYGLDLETVQKLYEKHKSNPPVVRNMPPVAGNITWSRQLLRRIEDPMKKFQTHKHLMQTKESKKIVRTYNKVARALIEFETLWHYAWSKSVEAGKAGLQATLIIRHPEDGRLYVNFDREILRLIRETKVLERMGVEVPESAKMVLLQEEKFKAYYNQLHYALHEYERVVARILPVVIPLMKPHLDDLEKKIQPGMVTLTWTSMNIDGYLHRIHQGLAKIEDLAMKVVDIVDNRIEKKLKMVSKCMLVDLPPDQSFTLDQFVNVQERHIKNVGHVLDAKNLEVENAVEDLVTLITSFTFESEQSIPQEEIDNLKEYYLRTMYRAVMTATKNSLFALKKRVGSRRAGGFLFVEHPFFDVDVELTVPEVSMNPSLDEIQFAVNRAAIAVLRCSKKLALWGQRGPDGSPLTPDATFFENIAKDKEIVKVVLLLTGGIEGLKSQVNEYLQTFRKYDYLWKDNKQEAYQAFLAKQPALDEFESQLREYMNVEKEIGLISPVHNIGALSLETQPLKYSLKSEASAWKAQYAQNLHIQAKDELEELVNYMKETTIKLNRKIGDLEDVRIIMGILKEIRERESEIDLQFGPVEETYSLLLKYDVRVPKEELDSVNDLRYSWKKLRKLSGDVSDNLAQLQAGFKRDLVRAVKTFVVDVMQFNNDYLANGPKVPGLKPADAMERLRKFQRLYEERERKWETYTAGEELFGLTITQYPELESMKKELQLLDKLYTLYMNVITTLTGYQEIAWSDVVTNIDQMTNQVNEFANGCKKLPKGLRDWDAYVEMKTTIDDFLETLPLLQALSSKAMRPRHWQQVMQVTGHDFKMDENFKLASLLEAKIVDFKDDIEDIANSAVKEMQIETKLKQLTEEWAEQMFTFANFKSRGPVILKGQETQDIVEKLEDSQMALGSMMSSRYITPFKEEVTQWVIKLSTVSEIIEQWVVVQSMWIYLEAVFSSGDIAKQLPQEAKRFSQVDKNWIKIMGVAFEKRNVIQSLYGNDIFKNLLPHLTEQLELCQKSLTGYLETKRNLFPRFFFVSDPVLLEILSQGSDPQAIQVHLQSCFDSIVSLTFDKAKKNEVMKMHSGEGEVVDLVTKVVAQGNIEDWLAKLEKEMQATMKEIIRNAASDCMEISLEDFIQKYPAQVGLLGIQFMWTYECQDALNRSKSDRKILSDTNKKQAAILSELSMMTLRDLSQLERTNIETLITIQVHQRDIFDEIVKKKVKDASDFEWQKQTRFYWKYETDDCVIAVADFDFKYCYEYLGCKERLVITPLTDRCYISLTQALGMFFGGSPAGPAGTGKTETVKDLGRSAGKYVVVFNCSDQMDYKALGKIYKGLCQSGAWGCFDEFNRIELEVLSVAAQQIASVLTAMRERRESFIFTDGQNVKSSPDTGLFITMNPGYAGRQELPENLKALFRGVTMMVPDRQIIIRVKLAAAGYQEATLLSKKFHILYRLCEEQLSKQPHYDFGLRNILSVLRTAGTTKRANPGKAENVLLFRTLRDMNLSKYVAEDVPLFLSLINDVFPGVSVEKARYPSVESAIQNRVVETRLIAHETWVEKIIQLYEMSLVRHGLMVVGPAGAGKTACIDILLQALTETGVTHKEIRMNPKAILSWQMFGALDTISNDWTDGIFSSLWRKANKNKNSNTWIICDGPVDAIWIENLNSVLDDNKLLTLANGDRIPMIPNVKLTFEVENLNNASPATVSRAGIIFMSATVLGWKPIAEAWLSSRRAQEGEVIKQYLDKYFDGFFTFVDKQTNPMMDVPIASQAATLLNILDSLLKPAVDASEILSEDHLHRMVIFSLMWSVGGALEEEDRFKVDEYLRTVADDSVLPPQSSEESIYEHVVDTNSTTWEPWVARVMSFNPTPGTDFSSLLVPTLDSTRIEYLMGLIVKLGKPALLIGGPGATKTSIANQFLNSCTNEETMAKSISFSSATTPGIYQQTIESIVEKRQGRTFGPPSGKKMVIFLDDMSMPEINEWGDQVTSEFARQLVEQRGFYNLEKPGEWKDIVDLQFIGAMTHPGGGRNDIPARLKRHFAVFNVTLPSKASIDHIYKSILGLRYNPKNFNKEIIDSVLKLTFATITLWGRVKAKMLPTPAKFHYIFNMRDISRVFQGFLQSPNEVITSTGGAISLWRHECCRVFSDKLTDNEDKQWFSQCLDSVTSDTFAGVTIEDYTYVDFLRECPVDPDTGEEIGDVPKVYEPAADIQTIFTRLEELMDQYNEANKVGKLELVLFDDAIAHMTRISRIIRTNRGSALLVGVGGSGKQSLTRLASFIAGYQTFQITITKSYNETNLFEDLKVLYKTCGVLGKPVTFLITDNEIKKESFLEYFNNILSSGEVPGLLPKDELDMIVGDMREPMKLAQPQTPDTWDNLYQFFVDRVRNNLHLVLCFSPVGEKFRVRARKFPALIGCCTIDWFLKWPRDALLDVAKKFVNSYEISCSDEDRNSLVDLMAETHTAVHESTEQYFDKFRRSVHVTPKSYLSFIASYKSVYDAKFSDISALALRINTGLDKLLIASQDVAKMKVELKEKEVELVDAQKKTSALLVDITSSTAVAEKKKSEVMTMKNKLADEAARIAADKASAEEDLAAAKPALEEAAAALKSVTPKDIQNLKALRNPPEMIKRIFDGVMILRHLPMERVQAVEVKGKLQIKDSYPNATKMMSDMKFLDHLTGFEKDNINDETCELLDPYLDQEDFNFEAAKKVSGNVAGLLVWVKSMSIYHFCAKIVGPKIEALRLAEGRLRVANGKLQAALDELAVVQGDLDKMQAEFDQAMSEKRRIEDDAEQTKKRMEAANALINGLSGERTRWTAQSKEFEDRLARLIGDVSVVCAFMAYCAPFNQEYRSMLRDNFFQMVTDRNIPASEEIDIISFLVDEGTIGEWNLEGLPTDELSIQNGIMVTRSTKYPLMIDPQGQGLAWIKNREEPNQVKITNLYDKNFRFHLEECMSFGRPLVLENIEEEIDPILDPVLEKQVQKSGKSLKIVLPDGKEVEFNEEFRIFMTTKLPNPQFAPEVFAKTNIIDFTVTMKGLESQLLGRVVLKEKYELEEQRQKLLEETNLYTKKIKELEDDLLHRLSNSTGNLLDDTTLIDVLATTKQTALEVNEKLVVAKETELKINATREDYRPVATRGSVMYFLVSDMSNVSPMYQTSLVQFLQVFDKSMDQAEKAPLPSKRINNIIEYLTYAVFTYITRGLLEEHKTMFGLLLALKIQLQSKQIDQKEFNNLLKGGAALDIKAVKKKPFEWVPDHAWLNVIQIATQFPFQDLPDHVQRNGEAWQQWYDCEAPEAAKIPEYEEKLDKFKRLLLVRAFREDRTIIAAQEYVASCLGQHFVESLPLDFDNLVSESDERTPLVFILTPGADPSNQIEAFAKKKKKELKAVSMGQGQEVIARRLLQNAFQQGSWVLLQNCHLGLKFLPEVEQTLLKLEDIDPDFRVWITSEPHPKFPIGLLQSSIKITNEAPQGIKAGLKRSYAWVNQDMLDAIMKQEWRTVLYTVCFIHTIVQERRKFGPLGWNIPYEFNQSDLQASVQFLQNHMSAAEANKTSLSWTTVKYMICEVQYGGRITDDHDRRLFNTYGDAWLGPKIFDPSFAFYPGYKIPTGSDIEKFRRAIEEVPAVDSPEVFGLHGNAELTYRTNQTNATLNTIIDIQPKEASAGGGLTREEIVDRQAQELLSKLPKLLTKDQIHDGLKARGGTKPLNICLGQEIDRLQKVISKTKQTLEDLQLAIAGTIIMSPELSAALDHIFDARVPPQWLKISWASPTLGLWFGGLLQRYDQLFLWLSKDRPHCFWLTGLFNPQGFLTAMRQEVTRKHQGWALDDVILFSEVTKHEKEEVKHGPDEGIYVYGLFLEGCSWDKKSNKLVDSPPKILFSPLPVLHVSAVQSNEKRVDVYSYQCPCYKTPRRTDREFIFTVDIRSEDPPQKWILRGVALLCVKEG